MNKFKDVERDITPDENQRMKELVNLVIHDAELSPEEKKELENLHAKQTRGIGGLTPNQFENLQQIKNY